MADLTDVFLRSNLGQVKELIDDLQSGELVATTRVLKVLRSYHSSLYQEQRQGGVIESSWGPCPSLRYADETGMHRSRHRPGWAVIEGAGRGSECLHVVRVEESPGDPLGEVTRMSSGRKAISLCVVQAVRSQARTMKERIRKERRLSKVNASDYWDQ